MIYYDLGEPGGAGRSEPGDVSWPISLLRFWLSEGYLSKV